MDWTTEESGFNSWGVRDFCLPHSLQTGSRTHPASSPVDTWGSYPGGKVTEAVHLQLVPMLNMSGAISLSPHMSSGRGAYIKAQGQVYLHLTTHTLPISSSWVLSCQSEPKKYKKDITMYTKHVRILTYCNECCSHSLFGDLRCLSRLVQVTVEMWHIFNSSAQEIPRFLKVCWLVLYHVEFSDLVDSS